MKGYNKRRTLLALLAPMLVLAACGDEDGGESTSGSTSVPADESKAVTFLLAFKPSISFLPIHLADELGYFEDEGLDVSVEESTGSSFAVQQVAAGQAEAGISIDTAVIFGASSSPTYRAIYEFYTEPFQHVYVPADSDLESVADLDGKVVGVNDLGGGEALAARQYLAGEGINADTDARLEAVGFDEPVQVRALQDGRVDAVVVTPDSTASYDLLDFEYKCISCDADTELSGGAIVVSDAVFDDKEMTIGIGRALAKATLFAATNPDAALAVMKDVTPAQFEDPAHAETLLKSVLETSFNPGDGPYGEMDEDAWQNRMDLMLEVESDVTELTTPVDLDRLVRNDYVEDYNDFDHEAVETAAKDHPTN